MTRTIWLASYPKSGNTWFRMLVANLAATDRPVDINNLPERGGIASARGPFDHLTLIESGLLTHDEADRLRPRVYEELKRGAPDDEYDAPEPPQPVRFVKCHDAYTYTVNGEPMLGGAKGAAVGATAGAGGGTAMVMSGDRSAAEFPAGTDVTARILSPVTVTVDR